MLRCFAAMRKRKMPVVRLYAVRFCHVVTLAKELVAVAKRRKSTSSATQDASVHSFADTRAGKIAISLTMFHAVHAQCNVRYAASTLPARRSAPKFAPHVWSSVAGLAPTDPAVGCHVQPRALGCLVTRGAPGSFSVAINVPASAERRALHKSTVTHAARRRKGAISSICLS